MKKYIVAFISALLILSISITTYAKDIAVCDNNCNNTYTYFSISNGKGVVENRVIGKKGITKKIVINTKVQKKVGLIWVTVDNGSWTDTSSAYNFSKSHSVQLSDKGTYRAHVKFTVSGTGGSDDEITKNVEKTYN